MAERKRRIGEGARGPAIPLSTEEKEQLSALLLRRSALTPAEAELLGKGYPAIVEMHFDRVWAVLFRRGARGPLLDDLLQEVFALFFLQTRAEGFPESIPRRLQEIAAGKIANHRRAALRNPVSLGLPSSRSELPRSAPEPERVLDDAMLAQRLLPALPPEQREIVHALFVRDLSHEEAATELGLVRTTFTSRLHAAKRKLAKMARRLLPPSQRGPR